MSRFKCNEKLSKKETNKSNKKFIMKLLAGLVAASSISGFAYASFRDIVTHDDMVKNSQVETNIENQNPTGPVFAKFMKYNMNEFKMIRKDLIRYKELHNMSSRSDRSEQEMQNLIEKINNSYSNSIKRLALNTVKAKIADANHLDSYEDIKIGVDMEEHYISIKDNMKNPLCFLKDDKTQIARTIFKCAELQNKPIDSKLSRIQNANMAYDLYNNTIKTANKTYLLQKISKDAKYKSLVEIDNINKSKKDMSRDDR